MGYDMYWVTKDPDEDKKVEAVREEWDLACNVRDAIPKEERGTPATMEQIRDGADMLAVPADASDRYKAAQEEVDRLYEEMRDARKSYFRLNIWGMGHYRHIMALLGMLNWRSDYPDLVRPGWPETDAPDVEELAYYLRETRMNGDPEEKAFEEFRKDHAEVEITDEMIEAAKAYDQAENEMKSWHPEGSLILGDKFGSNDGWLVTPEEIILSLEVYGKHTPEQVRTALESVYGKAEVAEHETAILSSWVEWIDFLTGAVQYGNGFRVY